MRFKNQCFKTVYLGVETSEDMFSAQGVKVNGRIQPLFKEGVSMWAEEPVLHTAENKREEKKKERKKKIK